MVIELGKEINAFTFSQAQTSLRGGPIREGVSSSLKGLLRREEACSWSKKLINILCTQQGIELQMKAQRTGYIEWIELWCTFQRRQHIFPRRTRKKFRFKSSQPSVRSSRNLPRESTSAASGAARRFQERKTTGKKVLIKIFD